MAAIDRCRNRSGPKGPQGRQGPWVGVVFWPVPASGGDGTRGEVANRNPP